MHHWQLFLASLDDQSSHDVCAQTVFRGVDTTHAVLGPISLLSPLQPPFSCPFLPLLIIPSFSPRSDQQVQLKGLGSAVSFPSRIRGGGMAAAAVFWGKETRLVATIVVLFRNTKSAWTFWTRICVSSDYIWWGNYWYWYSAVTCIYGIGTQTTHEFGAVGPRATPLSCVFVPKYLRGWSNTQKRTSDMADGGVYF